MRAGRAAGGGALMPTVFTYTAAMRAALAGGLLPRALQVGFKRILLQLLYLWWRLLQLGCQSDWTLPEVASLSLHAIMCSFRNTIQ